MTEEEWFALSDRDLHFAFAALSQRRQRLLAASACRALTEVLHFPGVRAALAAAEVFADTGKTKAALRRARQAVELDCLSLNARGSRHVKSRIVPALFAFKTMASENAVHGTVPSALGGLVCLRGVPYEYEDARRQVLPFVREVTGPEPPVAFAPAWRTSTAVALARQMYASREFGAMPILADALQDAGCEDEAILNHCRDIHQPHVRGCWVVDLVLGNEWPYSVPRR